MIIVYNYKDKKPFTIIGKKKSGSLPDEPENPEIPDLPDGVLPEVAENEDILAIKNVDTTEGTVYMRNPNSIAIQYSTDGKTFNEYTTETEVPIGVGEKVYFKWSDVISNSSNSTALVSSNVKYKTYGELKQGKSSYAYYKMFNNESNLTDASKLKLTATTLAPYCYYKMFDSCTSLTTAPELPATELASRCYQNMFQNCTSLLEAPTLPATTIASYCYYGMFYNCTSLTTAPAILPATTLSQSCYNNMFYGCTALTTAPALPATTIASYCYYGMFYYCSSLLEAPTLPATELASSCYRGMFYYCTALTTAPQLPATELASNCYEYMFFGCSSLLEAPTLPATELASSCYYNMFYSCYKLNYVKHYVVDWDASNTSSWLTSVAPSGTVECPANSTIPSDSTSGIPSGWTRVDIIDEPTEPELPEVAENEDILAIENIDTVEGTVKMTNPNNKTIQYSTDGSKFNKYTSKSEIPIGVGEKVYFKWSDVLSTSSNQNKVNSTVKYKAYGELKKGNNEYAYRKMFTNETNLIDASKLKLTATTLAEWCYSGMFGGTALTTAPELPATELASRCYYSMFSGCTSLTTAPELPATTMKTGCYNSMFQDCTSLTTAPALPATKLVSECFYRMFYGCTSLNYVKHNITTWNTSYTSYWLKDVASSGTVECPANSTIPSNNTSGIPTGWTRVDITEPTVPIE